MKPDINFLRNSINAKVDPLTDRVRIERRRLDNIFDILPANSTFRSADVPFRTFENSRFLEDTLKKAWLSRAYAEGTESYKVIYSQHKDSVLKPMMHRSDNFFAEQMLLVAGNEFLGVMNEGKMIDTLLKTDLKDLPQRPRWADGSGLSRYNLFTPKDFVMLLEKMKNEFGIARLQEILPTGNEGTLSNYYKQDSGYIFAKTGTLSGVVAFSGFMYTPGNRSKLLIFSVLVNNHQASATQVRRAVERFLQEVRRSGGY
jgi:serine-type D-Ala-D-Ala carboxypeptidase/endopeptidase (penicillin-binding protein 4)